ncbi:MAG: hypothetical protein Kow0097_06930 [Candidatus Bipolaricaulota bacterium]
MAHRIAPTTTMVTTITFASAIMNAHAPSRMYVWISFIRALPTGRRATEYVPYADQASATSDTRAAPPNIQPIVPASFYVAVELQSGATLPATGGPLKGWG